MNRSKGWVIGAAGTAAFGVLMACVGDDPATTPTPQNDSGVPGDSATTTDAPAAETGGTDGAPEGPCDLDAPFGAPVAMTALNTTDAEVSLRFSPDGELAYFARGTPGTNSFDIMVATRSSGFADATKVVGVNHPSGGFADNFPNVSLDGNEMILSSNDAVPPDGGSNEELKRATRNTTGPGWTRAPLAGFVTGSYAPYVTGDGKALYFCDLNAGLNIRRAQRLVDGSFSAPVVVVTNGNYPVVAVDESIIYFSRNAKLFYAKRTPGSTVAFDPPQEIPALAGATATWISADGCKLAVAMSGALSSDLFTVSKPKR